MPANTPSGHVHDAMQSRGFVLCTVAAVLFGISAPLASQLAEQLRPFTLAGALYPARARTSNQLQA